MSVVGKATCRVAGFRQLVKAGKVYEDNDPIVKARPELFEEPEQHQRRKARPTNTAELGQRSMAGRHVESARSAPGEERTVDFPCPDKEGTGCAETFGSVRAAKIHAKKAHG